MKLYFSSYLFISDEEFDKAKETLEFVGHRSIIVSIVLHFEVSNLFLEQQLLVSMVKFRLFVYFKGCSKWALPISRDTRFDENA
jgi:hypothetical protein